MTAILAVTRWVTGGFSVANSRVMELLIPLASRNGVEDGWLTQSVIVGVVNVDHGAISVFEVVNIIHAPVSQSLCMSDMLYAFASAVSFNVSHRHRQNRL